jgi:hypothetical protein
MRAALFCALALLGASALPAASPSPGDPAVHTKASSFEPHSGSRGRVYGAPIQQRILKSRPKPQQLKTSPLPEAPAA